MLKSYGLHLIVNNFPNWSSLPPENSGGWFYEYQTLIASLIALLAALITAGIIRKNHIDLLNKENLKAKAYMRQSTSDICSYCQHIFNQFWVNFESENISLDLSSEPKESLNHLRNGIPYLDNKSAETAFELLSLYQIFNSRFENVNDFDNQTHVVLAVHISTLACKLLEYARGNTEFADNSDIGVGDIVSRYNVMRGNYYGSGRTYSAPAEQERLILELIENRFQK